METKRSIHDSALMCGASMAAFYFVQFLVAENRGPTLKWESLKNMAAEQSAYQLWLATSLNSEERMAAEDVARQEAGRVMEALLRYAELTPETYFTHSIQEIV